MIGRNIHNIRKKRGLTLTQLAEQANISKSYLSNIEREINDNPSIHVMEKISSVLGVELKSLLDVKPDHAITPEVEWLELAKELKESGIEIDVLREYKSVFEFVKWKNTKIDF
ncbi:helix-turn-helix domain-containing protein [Bacillus sp. AFS041924]|uniref:helix-turn-helix domain-containing protein n=1 Tax=Bacillus sp. AFS041924 TaxID=2033503 RepID=UPI000BFCF487|nr:helix-turn-helix transcriptional regulator [Bacillus sp. AFS041924]PGS52654.1 transcriptional regulator [Bacillus sp. AFS041924]